MNRTQIRSALLTAALALAVPAVTACPLKGTATPQGAACSAPHGGMRTAGHGHHAIPGQKPHYLRALLRHADAIGLNAGQREAVGNLLVKAETAAAEAHARAKVAAADFRALHRSGKATERDVKRYAERMGELRAAMLKANLGAMLKAEALLTDKQRSSFNALFMPAHGKAKP